MMTFTQISNEIFESELPASEKLVLIALHRYAFGTKIECFPSQQSLAKDTTLCLKTVNTCIRKLTEKKFISKSQRYSAMGNPLSLSYELCIKKEMHIANQAKFHVEIFKNKMDSKDYYFYKEFSSMNLNRWKGSFPSKTCDIHVLAKNRHLLDDIYKRLILVPEFIEDGFDKGDFSIPHFFSPGILRAFQEYATNDRIIFRENLMRQRYISNSYSRERAWNELFPKLSKEDQESYKADMETNQSIPNTLLKLLDLPEEYKYYRAS